jgi:hypothetical protein
MRNARAAGPASGRGRGGCSDRGFEDEPDPSTAITYLAEHGLLTEWEREALADNI